MKRTIGFKALTFGAAAAALLAFQPASHAAETFDMKIGYPTTADPQHHAAVRYVKLIAEKTKGRIKGRVFPTSQLGRIPRQIEGIQLGTQEVFMAPPGFLIGLNPAFQVVDVPAMFANPKHAHEAITDKAFADKFLMLAENKGVIGGVVWIYDGTSYASTVPLRTLADFKGKKIRVLATPMERAVVAAFGAAGVPIPFTEVVPSLQRKVVDAARSSLVVMANAKFPSVCKYLTITNGAYIATASWFSKIWLNKLPADLRKIVLETVRGMADWSSANAQSFVASKTEEWKKTAEVSHLSAAEQKIFMDRLRPLGDKLLGKNKNAQVREMYAMLKASAKRHAPKM